MKKKKFLFILKPTASVVAIAIISAACLCKPISLAAINAYQKWVSPYKGYQCAYHALHESAPSCSRFGEMAITDHGLITGLLVLNRRLDACQQAAATIKEMHAGNECNMACKECGNWFKQALDALKQAILDWVKNLLKEIKDACMEWIENLLEDIQKKVDEFVADVKRQMADMVKNTKDAIRREPTKKGTAPSTDKEGGSPSAPKDTTVVSKQHQNELAPPISPTPLTGGDKMTPSEKTGLKAAGILKENSRDKETTAADPIALASGAHVIQYDVLTVNGAIPITCKIGYHSLTTELGPAGRGWDLEYGYGSHLEFLSEDKIMLHWHANRRNIFRRSTDGAYTCPDNARPYERIIQNKNRTYSLVRRDGTHYVYHRKGILKRVVNRHGRSLIFKYQRETGRLHKIVEPVSGKHLSFKYNSDGLIESVGDPQNRMARFSYNRRKDLVRFTDARGATVTHEYNANGQILRSFDGEGRRYFQNIIDARGRVIVQDDGIDGNKPYRFSYDETKDPGKIITTFTNRNGETRTYVFNGEYQLVRIDDEYGLTTVSYTYDEMGNIIRTTDATGRTLEAAFDAHGNIIRLNDSSGAATRMKYDASSNLVAVTDAMGRQTGFTYDDHNRLLEHNHRDGRITRYRYGPDGHLAKIEGPQGRTTQYQYEKGMLIRITDPENGLILLAHDNAGRIIRRVDGNGNTHRFTYDQKYEGACYAIAVTDPLGNTVTSAYDSRDNLLSTTDARGNTTQYEHDANGNVTARIDAMGHRTTFKYDGEGRPVEAVDPNGNATHFTYDLKGRLIEVANALGVRRTMAYDKADRLKKFNGPGGKGGGLLAYDSAGNLVSVEEDGGDKTIYIYDKYNRLVESLDAVGRKTEFTYDANDRLSTVTDPLAGESSQVFNHYGDLISLVDPNGNATRFEYDRCGRHSRIVPATGHGITYSYNDVGLLSSMKNARGQKRSFRYDSAGRLRAYADKDGKVYFKYDTNGNLLVITDKHNVITREYDPLNRLSAFTDQAGNRIEYEYDSAGNLSRLTYPDGKSVGYRYDQLNRLVTVEDFAGRITRYAYDANGHPTRCERSNGTITECSYDPSGRLVSQKDTGKDGQAIFSCILSYDGAGCVIDEKVDPPLADLNLAPVSMTYSAGNRLATFNGQPVSYDRDGNIVRGPLRGNPHEFVFDSRNRLIKAGELTYRYDSENNRIAIANKNTSTRYVVNPNALLSQVLVKQASDGGKTVYIYGLGLIGHETEGKYFTYHYDFRGSTTAITDQKGEVVARFQYAPYGLIVHRTGSMDTPFLYNGRDGVMTDDNGLYYMRARYYHPGIRRFMNEDTILGGVRDGQSLNRMAYVQGNPVSFVDPLGLEKIQADTRVPDDLAGLYADELERGLSKMARTTRYEAADAILREGKYSTAFNRQRRHDAIRRHHSFANASKAAGKIKGFAKAANRTATVINAGGILHGEIKSSTEHINMNNELGDVSVGSKIKEYSTAVSRTGALYVSDGVRSVSKAVVSTGFKYGNFGYWGDRMVKGKAYAEKRWAGPIRIMNNANSKIDRVFDKIDKNTKEIRSGLVHTGQ